MPLKERAARPTRAEQFFARRDDLMRGIANIWHFDGSPREGDLHNALADAVERGFLDDEIERNREYLAAAVGMALGRTESEYERQEALDAERDRISRLRTLDASICEFLDAFEGEVSGFEHGLEKVKGDEDAPVPDEELRALEVGLGTRDAILSTGWEFIAHLRGYLSEGHAAPADATILEEREVFRSLDRWWRRACRNPKGRGASAARNRIAAAVWNALHMGIDGAEDHPADWAMRKFKAHCDNGEGCP